MGYQKQTFIDYPNDGYTVLKAEHLNHIEDGISTLYNAFYDTRTESISNAVGATCNLSSPDYNIVYSTSTFSGWCGYIGKPTNFNQVKFPIKPRKDYPITQITVSILEVPSRNNITFIYDEQGNISANNPFTPKPNAWAVVATQNLVFEDGELFEDSFNQIECTFDTVITNSENKCYYLSIICNNLVTMGLLPPVSTTSLGLDFNPWTWYFTNGGNTPSGISGGERIYPTYDFVYPLACAFYYQQTAATYSVIGTEKKDKFFKLVNECLNNSESLGEVFEESYTTRYTCGSIDLSRYKATKYGNSGGNSGSTFTGVVFPIGRVPAEIDSTGVLLQLKARAHTGGNVEPEYLGQAVPITKVYVYLYAVSEPPVTSKYKGESFEKLNPVLLRTGIATCNIEVESEDTVYIAWNEGSFNNTENKFLMLGYACNAYNYRCLTNKSGSDVCKSIDGNTYGALETWYAHRIDNAGYESWSPRWEDTSANAWSLVTAQKRYILGAKFNTMLEEALEQTINSGINMKANTSEVCLAKQYDLVVDDTFQLFYEGVIKGFDVLNEGIYVYCNGGGKAYPRFWEFTPTEADSGKTYTLTIATRQLDGSIISTGNTSIVVHPKLTNESVPDNLNALIFGDSLTSSGTWAAEGFRRIYGMNSTASGPASLGLTKTVTTYGSKSNTQNTFKINHEGYGGWTWNSFLTPERGKDSTTNGIIITLTTAHNYNIDEVQKSVWIDNNGLNWELEDFPSTTQIKFNRGTNNNQTQTTITTPTTLTCAAKGLTITPSTVVWETLNPFYDEASNSLNFTAHANKYGNTGADLVACLLTWNGGGGEKNFNHTSKIETHMDKAKQLLLAIHTEFPKAKIICMGIQLSSITGGAGANYAAKGTYGDTWGTVFYAFDYNKALEKLITEDIDLNSYCYYVDTKGQFDTRYCMPYANVAVNTRSTLTELRGTNGVHPNTEGYYQIGDAFYRALTKVIPLCKNEEQGE